MNKIQILKQFALNYKIELILTVCLFSNLYVFWLPKNLYFLALFAMAYFMNRYHVSVTGRTGLTYALIGVVILSSMVSGHTGGRMLLMSYILFVTLAYSSEEYYRFKFRFMYVSLIAYALTCVINFYAKRAGVNFYEGVQIMTWGSSSGEFSGYTCHPMWLSAACGIGTIFFVYSIIVTYKRGWKRVTWLLLAASFAALWTAMQGGSRSASGVAVLCSLFLLLTSFEDARQKRKILLPIILVGILTLPSMVMDNAQFARKVGGLELRDETGQSSRTKLWADRIEEFNSSPLLGVGFGITGIGNDAQEGRAETGSGWLTVLSQTGIIGFLLVCMMVFKARLPKRILESDSTAALLQAVLLFMIIHSLFEAYMFQAGWYMCFVFWLLVGLLDDYKTYGPLPELENSLFGEEDEYENENDNDNLNPNLNFNEYENEDD